MKVCYKCKIRKDLNCFNKNNQSKDGLRYECKECQAAYGKKYYKENKDSILFYRNENRDRVREIDKKSYNKNKEQRKIKKREYYVNNMDKVKKSQKKYRDANKVRIYTRMKKYYTDRLNNDLCYKTKCCLRSRLGAAIKNKQKSGSAVSDLGCSIGFLKEYLEEKFYNHSETDEKMTWDNWSQKGWHIDHIIPLSSFDLTDREQFLKAVHYTNLQPLWAEENLKKGAKIITED